MLFDQNLPPRLVDSLSDLFPNSTHVMAVGLDQANDKDVWDYAFQDGYTVVTKDAECGELSLLLGFPPKVIWIRRGNCPTKDIEGILRENSASIESINDDSNTGLLMVF